MSEITMNKSAVARLSRACLGVIGLVLGGAVLTAGCASAGPDDSLANWIHCYYSSSKNLCVCGTDTQLYQDIGDVGSSYDGVVAVDDCTEASTAQHFNAAAAECQADITPHPYFSSVNSACFCTPLKCAAGSGNSCSCSFSPQTGSQSMASCSAPTGGQCCASTTTGNCSCSSTKCSNAEVVVPSCSAASADKFLPAVDALNPAGSGHVYRTAACMPFLASHPVE